MRRLTRLLRWLRRDDGISLILVGVCLAVLLALAGMAVDLGVVYAERRELRNGADAAALAIAEDCGMGTRPCDEVTALTTAEEYADANAWDGSSAVDGVELTFTGPDAGTVRVRTRAWDAAAGQSGVRVPLLTMLGFNRVQVGAAATALFDYPASGGGLPIVIDECEYAEATYGGSVFERSVTLLFKDPSSDGERVCSADPAGKDAPGAFGWLETDGTNCWTQVATSPPWPQADPGASPSRGCSPTDLLALVGKEVVLPIYYDLCGDSAGNECEDKDAGGRNTYYAISGLAPFVIEKYYFSGQYRHPSGYSCGTGNSADRCIQGHFVAATTSSGQPGGRDFGLLLIKLTE